MIAAGAVLLPGTQVPGGQLWSGNPAIFMRNLTEADIAALDKVCSVEDVV
jgi:gamma-carbonic anhydrase